MPRSLLIPGYTFDSKLESREATIFIGWYTFVLHFLASFYFLDVYRGSASDWVPSPLFEYSGDSMESFALMLAAYSTLFMFFGSLGLIRGVKTETRIYYFPWFFMSSIEIVFLLYQALALWLKYSYDANTSIFIIVLIIFTVYHLYLYLVVLSNYRFLKRIQSPTIIFPTDMH